LTTAFEVDKGLSVGIGIRRCSRKNKLSEAQSLFTLRICSVCKIDETFQHDSCENNFHIF